jgi:hypothetical protein
MRKLFAASAVAFVTGALPVHAQTPQPGASMQNRPGAEELKAALDGRIELIKYALQLTPAQEKLWPPVEDAIRTRVNARNQRLMTLAASLSDDRERDPFDMLRERADMLGQRAANLKKYVDAWQPLYTSLDTRQKLRLRFLASYSLRQAKEAVASRFDDMEDGEW